ncbi:hypothetical protein BKA64DRAFT_267389 [Cadophora sp. MPI-SDFR-AT-0126]|nr:hypothetical protein BKA64DRAFT_267389 [Leotiomycetes sp. MPI-SDFR-AT-0126]
MILPVFSSMLPLLALPPQSASRSPPQYNITILTEYVRSHISTATDAAPPPIVGVCIIQVQPVNMNFNRTHLVKKYLVRKEIPTYCLHGCLHVGCKGFAPRSPRSGDCHTHYSTTLIRRLSPHLVSYETKETTNVLRYLLWDFPFRFGHILRTEKCSGLDSRYRLFGTEKCVRSASCMHAGLLSVRM